MNEFKVIPQRLNKQQKVDKELLIKVEKGSQRRLPPRVRFDSEETTRVGWITHWQNEAICKAWNGKDHTSHSVT